MEAGGVAILENEVTITVFGAMATEVEGMVATLEDVISVAFFEDEVGRVLEVDIDERALEEGREVGGASAVGREVGGAS